MTPTYTTAQEIAGLKVRVYKNLHNGKFSVMHRGKVIAHVERISLHDVTFTVQPAARLKVLATRKKIVHAFVNGIVSPIVEDGAERVTYNPYKYESFVTSVGAPIHAAKYCTISTLSGVLAHR